MGRSDTLVADAAPGTLDEALDVLDRGFSGGDFQVMQVWRENDAVSCLYRVHRLRFGAEYDPSIQQFQSITFD
jgi:hypothetical protein